MTDLSIVNKRGNWIAIIAIVASVIGNLIQYCQNQNTRETANEAIQIAKEANQIAQKSNEIQEKQGKETQNKSFNDKVRQDFKQILAKDEGLFSPILEECLNNKVTNNWTNEQCRDSIARKICRAIYHRKINELRYDKGMVKYRNTSIRSLSFDSAEYCNSPIGKLNDSFLTEIFDDINH